MITGGHDITDLDALVDRFITGRHPRTLLTQPPRAGQSLFNALVRVDPAAAEAIRGTALDPFHHDARIDDMLRWWGQRCADNAKGEP